MRITVVGYDWMDKFHVELRQIIEAADGTMTWVVLGRWHEGLKRDTLSGALWDVSEAVAHFWELAYAEETGETSVPPKRPSA